MGAVVSHWELCVIPRPILYLITWVSPPPAVKGSTVGTCLLWGLAQTRPGTELGSQFTGGVCA